MIVLDTHTWIWWHSDPDQLSKLAVKQIRAADRIGVSAISCWELAMMVAKGRITLDRSPVDWMLEALAAEKAELVPITPAIAVRSTQLGGFHGDPADRLIVATALSESVPLVTKDQQIRDYASVKTIW